jgi:hypothetical protein
VRAAIIASAIGGAVGNPMLAFIDDDELRAELLVICHRLFGLLDEPAR